MSRSATRSGWASTGQRVKKAMRVIHVAATVAAVEADTARTKDQTNRRASSGMKRLLSASPRRETISPMTNSAPPLNQSPKTILRLRKNFLAALQRAKRMKETSEVRAVAGGVVAQDRARKAAKRPVRLVRVHRRRVAIGTSGLLETYAQAVTKKTPTRDSIRRPRLLPADERSAIIVALRHPRMTKSTKCSNMSSTRAAKGTPTRKSPPGKRRWGPWWMPTSQPVRSARNNAAGAAAGRRIGGGKDWSRNSGRTSALAAPVTHRVALSRIARDTPPEFPDAGLESCS
jgi:hypothetical protein